MFRMSIIPSTGCMHRRRAATGSKWRHAVTVSSATGVCETNTRLDGASSASAAGLAASSRAARAARPATCRPGSRPRSRNYIYIYIYIYIYLYICKERDLCVYINVRCVASTQVTLFLSVQVRGEPSALTCRPAGFHSEAAGAIACSRRGQI